VFLMAGMHCLLNGFGRFRRYACGFEGNCGVLIGRGTGFECFCTFWMTGTRVLTCFVSIDWHWRGF